MIELFLEHGQLTTLGTISIVILLAIIAGILTYFFYTRPQLHTYRQNTTELTSRLASYGLEEIIVSKRHFLRGKINNVEVVVLWYYKLNGFFKSPFIILNAVAEDTEQVNIRATTPNQIRSLEQLSNDTKNMLTDTQNFPEGIAIQSRLLSTMYGNQFSSDVILQVVIPFDVSNDILMNRITSLTNATKRVSQEFVK